MEIEGRIILDLGQTEGVSQRGNNWKKHEYVLETLAQTYPKKVKFHLFGARVDEIHLEVGKDYVLSIDLESREFNGRWYTDVNCYGARQLESQIGVAQNMQPQNMQLQQMPGGFPQAPAGTPDFTESSFGGDSSSDLPF